ncbi:Putative membrane associated protein [Borrelia nietonii YOR]|uniref:Membrane associated protein n=1 Tax=Borrelia nietonii YOR TaxID=1293576 RepID=A0ABM5PI53_9SPIR|nr:MULTISPECIES: phosphodiester glycosidase family protein [Borrelia]AHH03839.1 Putative membrane associated protein [Borrelia nietonii YOR]AHH14322.1 Putative membrane associated protein [Borrelia hermsii MTW]UPA09504.1 phosphodiester glycosidase family protein [Borrelia nietonii YOR]
MNKKILGIIILSVSLNVLSAQKPLNSEDVDMKYEIIKSSFKESNYVIVKIKNKNLKFIIPKPIYDQKMNNYYFKGQTTSQFLLSNKVDIAINTSPYEIKENMFYPNGLYIYDKKIISNAKKTQGIIIIKNNQIILNPKQDEIKNSDYGFSGFFPLITNGTYTKNFKENKHPRTIIGTDKENKHLYLITVEGRGTNNSKGISLNEAIDLSLNYAITNSINLDGGGSSTLVTKFNNLPHKLNVTSNLFGQERMVPFHLGIKLPN